MKLRSRICLALVLLLPFADACSELKRLAYDDMGRRDAWQRPDDVIRSLAIVPGSKIADVGAGGGYFSFRLAEAVGPNGIVYAVDVDEGMLQSLRERAGEENVANLITVAGELADPKLPEKVDLIFVSNTYHHIEQRVAYFEGVKRYLSAGGRVAIVEYMSDGLLQSCGHSAEAETIRGEMERAGYSRSADFDFLDRQSFQIFEPKAG